MTPIAKLNGLIGRIQSVPDRRLPALYATLAVFIAMCARLNTLAAGWTIVVAFFLVGAIRAIRYPSLWDTLLSYVVGLATGVGALHMTQVLAPAVVRPRSGFLLAVIGGMAFACSSAAISPLVRLAAERATRQSGVVAAG